MQIPLRHSWLIQKTARYPQLGELSLCGHPYDGHLHPNHILCCPYCKLLEAVMDSIDGPFERVEDFIREQN